VTCPFTGDKLVAVPPLAPDVALLHAPLGDAAGNLHLDQPYVLDERFAHASLMVVATVDRLVSTSEVAAAGVTVPAHVVAAVVEAPFGAHPASCYPGYGYDRPHLAAYLAAATAGGDRLAGYLDRYVHAGERAYRAEIDTARITSWSSSDAAWQELFR
jgi:glutaconate CoA-transferase subunit A